MPKAKASTVSKNASPAKGRSKRPPTHTEEQKEEVAKARRVLARFRATKSGDGIEEQEKMTLAEAEEVMIQWRERVDAAKS